MRLGFIYSNSPMSLLMYAWKDYYIIYHNRLLYVLGLEFSHFMTSYAVTNVLTWYFTVNGNDLVTSTILPNFYDSLSSFFVVFMAFSADSVLGRFHILLFLTTAYIGGLMILLMFNPYDVRWLLVAALVLLALGASGSNALRHIFIELVNDIDKSQEQSNTRSIARAKIWLRITYVFAAILAILFVAPDYSQSSWTISFSICIITMTTTLLIFCKGHNVYRQDEFTERPVAIFLRLLCACIQKLINNCNSWCLRNTSGQAQNLEIEMGKNEGIMQEISQPCLYSKEHEDRGGSSYKEDMEVTKSFFRMFPMWGLFLMVSVTLATGNTFFLQQYSNLNTKDQIVVQIYNLVQVFSSFLVLKLYPGLLCKNERVKIGVGMLFGIISYVLAWQLEVHRLKVVEHLADEDAKTSISFLRLFPQFCTLGCMQGLAGDGLLNFYKSQIKIEPIRSYGEQYIEVVQGCGRLLNIVLVLIFNSQLGWFGDTINESRVDKYYRILIFVCSVNFIIYCFVAKFFYKDAEQRQHSASHSSQQDYQEEP